MTQNYSDKTLDVLFQEIKDQLNRIELQTVKTNGTVANLKSWKAYITGALTAITLLVLPTLGYLALTLLNHIQK